jgi:hypothetical protein
MGCSHSTPAGSTSADAAFIPDTAAQDNSHSHSHSAASTSTSRVSIHGIHFVRRVSSISIMEPPTVEASSAAATLSAADQAAAEALTLHLAGNWFFRGNQLAVEGRHSEACAAFDAALQLSPLYIKARYQRGLSKLQVRTTHPQGPSLPRVDRSLRL